MSSYNASPGATNYLAKTVKIDKNVKTWHFAYIGSEAEIATMS